MYVLHVPHGSFPRYNSNDKCNAPSRHEMCHVFVVESKHIIFGIGLVSFFSQVYIQRMQGNSMELQIFLPD